LIIARHYLQDETLFLFYASQSPMIKTTFCFCTIFIQDEKKQLTHCMN